MSPQAVSTPSILGPIGQRLSGLLETPRRAGVWPDSVQVLGGFALFWAAHPFAGVAHFRFAVRRAPYEAWLKRGLPSS